MILALDTATHTGWCLRKDGSIVESGVEDFSKRRGESNGSMFLRFRRWLLDMLATWPDIKLVVYERAHHRGGAATEICTNLTGRVQEACAERGLEYAAVPSGTIKKFGTGNGGASKEDMMAAASRLAGHAIESDDEADAIVLSAYAEKEYGNV